MEGLVCRRWGDLDAHRTFASLAMAAGTAQWSTRVNQMIKVGMIGSALVLGVPELIGQKAGIDWNEALGNEVPPHRFPPFFRMPDVWIEKVFFRKPGPLSWQGRPLQTYIDAAGGKDETYHDEPALQLDYDSQGFRNAESASDWDVVVTGDSYTELGCLPLGDLFTSVAADLSELRVKNVATSSCGTWAQECFLRRFGQAPSCRRAVLAFFEGNDITDAEADWQALERHRMTGWIPARGYRGEASLMTASWNHLPQFLSPSSKRTFANASLKLDDRDVPVTVNDTWLPPAKLTPNQGACLHRALAAWVATARRLGMKPSLLFLPACNRVYAGRLGFNDRSPLLARDWQPNALPDDVKALCTELGMDFINPTIALRTALDSGTMVYNPVGDFHFNAAGSRIVGETLAQALIGQ
jgi:hypothetical protein